VPSLLQRLKERKIVQWAIVYLAGAWLFLEALGFVADNFGWSTFITRSAIVLAAVGFFAVLVLAWYHGEKGRQRASGVELLILAGILVIAGAAVALLGRGLQGDVAGGLPDLPVREKSVAVLPFVNIGGDPENETFTDGVTFEIIGHLNKIADLKVISRTSIMQYKETTKNIRQIGEELGVATLVEGEVQRVGDRVRIRAQFIDARADEHVWSEQYERQLTDVFAIQSDIAQRVAAGLRATLTVAEREAIQQRPTDNLEAHEYYVRAIEIYNLAEIEVGVPLTLELAEKAVELDPQFAQAWALLSEAHCRLYWHYVDRSEDRLAEALSAALKALELRPGLGEARRALGFYYYWGFLDYERALEQFALALNSTPNDYRVWAGIGYVRRRQGQWQEALDHMKKALELNPRAPSTVVNLAETYYLMREYAESEQFTDQVISLYPDSYPDPQTYGNKAWLYLQWQGSTERARAALELLFERVDSVELRTIGRRWYPLVELFERNYPEALERLSSTPSDIFETQYYFVPRSLRYAQIYGLMGQSDRESAYYDSARVALETRLRESSDDPRLHSSLGIAYAGLGRKDEAVREAKRGVELMPVEKEAWKGVYRVEDLARVYVMVGEYDAAIDQLDYLLSIPGEISVPLLRIDPAWDPLHDHRRFQALLAKYEQES
jgi:TolB-like protein/Flp pilus assembly protein TadD